jgi:regulator of protease activity HflC (stomatin/prohibitin superfamily)
MTVFFNGFLLRSARILDIFDCRFKLVIFKKKERRGNEMTEKKKRRHNKFFLIEDAHEVGFTIDFKRVIPVVILLVILFLTLVASMVSVGVGHAALIIHPLASENNKVSKPILGPAFGFFKNPFLLEGKVDIYYEIDTLGMWGDGTDKYADYPAIPAFSKDQLEMNIDVMVRWSLDPDKLTSLYQKYPNLDYKEKVIASIVREQLRIVTSTKYTAVETIELRNQVAQDIKSAILEKLATEPTLYGAIINFEFDLRNIGYPQSYSDAITAKLSAQQQMMQADYDKQKVIILAQADAQKVIINAQALANATILQSQGKAEAIKLISNQTGISSADLTSLFLWLETIREIKPQMIFISGQNGTSFIYPLTPTTSP